MRSCIKSAKLLTTSLHRGHKPEHDSVSSYLNNACVLRTHPVYCLTEKIEGEVLVDHEIDIDLFDK